MQCTSVERAGVLTQTARQAVLCPGGIISVQSTLVDWACGLKQTMALHKLLPP